VGFGVPSPAWAGNVSLPRVPPTFTDAQCLTIASPGDHIALGLTVPYEDTSVSDDEPVDSRTLQFFAVCRDADVATDMPSWIDLADVSAAQAADPGVPTPAPDDVLRTASRWQAAGHDGAAGTCVVDVHAARLPITCDATAPGVQWDTTGAAPGGYVIWGYTYEPVASLWTRKPGVVWLRDPQAPAPPPVVALTFPFTDATFGIDAGLRVTGCAAGSEGATVALQWATAADLAADPDAWRTTTTRAVGDGVVELDWWPSPSLLYEAVFLRAVATDPAGRTFTTSAAGPVVALPGAEPPGGGRPPWADGCRQRPSPWPLGQPGQDPPSSDEMPGHEPPTTGEPGDDTDNGAASADPQGCSLPGRTPWAPLWVGLCLVPRRRRRRT
jgi:hypothetical protein